MRILIVEDNEKIAKYIKQVLEESAYSVDCVFEGETGERMARTTPYDLLILDIMLPKKDGISICKDLRSDDFNMPIIMMTALGEVGDRILGLDSGADDYIIKPFDTKELLARIQALFRRPKGSVENVLKVGEITLDSNKHSVLLKGKELSLTTKEFSILEYLMMNRGKVVTRENLIEHCWDFAFNSFSNITDVYIKQLRKKLKDTNEKYIETIRGVGYRFVE